MIPRIPRCRPGLGSAGRYDAVSPGRSQNTREVPVSAMARREESQYINLHSLSLIRMPSSFRLRRSPLGMLQSGRIPQCLSPARRQNQPLLLYHLACGRLLKESTCLHYCLAAFSFSVKMTMPSGFCNILWFVTVSLYTLAAAAILEVVGVCILIMKGGFENAVPIAWAALAIAAVWFTKA